MAGHLDHDASPPVRLLVRVALPPILGWLMLAGYVGVEALGFRGLTSPDANNVSEAAALGRAAHVLELVAAGQDLNSRFHVRAGMLDGDTHELAPVEAAVLARHAELVRLLLRSGAAPGGERGACLARARLPEVLPDFGVSPPNSPGEIVDLATAMRNCVPTLRSKPDSVGGVPVV